MEPSQDILFLRDKGIKPRLFEYYSWFVEKFILKKEMPRGRLFFFVQALMDKKLHRMKVTTISEVYHAVISTAFKCRGRK